MVLQGDTETPTTRYIMAPPTEVFSHHDAGEQRALASWPAARARASSGLNA